MVRIKTGWWPNIFNKKLISKKRVCPPHCLLHKLPFTKPVVDEACHIHTGDLRMMEHSLACKYQFKCSNYNFMIKKYHQYLKKRKKENIFEKWFPWAFSPRKNK